MQQVTFKLVADQERPVVIVERGMTALLDTGAYIPLWTDEESILIDKFGATLHKTGIKFTGYGGVAFGNHYFLNITVPDSESMVRNLRISEKNGRLHVLCNSVWTI